MRRLKRLCSHIKLRQLLSLGKYPKFDNIDTSLPTDDTAEPGTIAYHPVYGVYFVDLKLKHRVWRVEHLSRTNTNLLVFLYPIIKESVTSEALCNSILEELQSRGQEEEPACPKFDPDLGEEPGDV